MAMYLQSDTERVEQQISQEKRDKGSEFPLALIQAAQGAGHEPLSAEYQASCIEVYLNGSETAALVFHGKRLVLGDRAALFSTSVNTIVIEIDGIFRYCEILSDVLLDTVGEFSLPKEINLSVEAQVNILVKALGE